MFRYFKRCLDTNFNFEIKFDFFTKLLQSPEPSDPQDAEVAKHYLSNKSGFEETAAYWTKIYASDGVDGSGSGSGSSNNNGGGAKLSDSALYGIDDEIVGQYESMGFPRDKTIQVLRRMGIKSFKGVGNKSELENKILEELLRECQ